MEKMAAEVSPEQERIRKLEAEAAAFWKQERKEGEPQIKFKIVYGAHTGSKDLEAVKKEFAAFDVYAPENFGWHPDSVLGAEQVIHGQVTPEAVDKWKKDMDPDYKNRHDYGFQSETVKMFYKSRKPLVLIDVPYNHKLAGEEHNRLSMLNENLLRSNDLETKKEILREMLVRFASQQKERENYIFAHIPQRIKELLLKKPELKRKPELKVLISLGSYHTRLFHMMQKANPKIVSQSFPVMPYEFSLDNVVQRSVAFGTTNPKDIPDETLYKMVMGFEFVEYFRKSIARSGEKDISEKFMLKAYKYIKKFTPQEIKEFYEERSKGKKFRDLFLELLSKKGVLDSSL